LPLVTIFIFALWLSTSANAQIEPSPDTLLQSAGPDIARAINDHNYPKAEGLLIDSIHAHPDSVRLLPLLGGVFFLDRKYLNCATALEKANAAGALDESSRFTLVMAYMNLNRTDLARPELESLIKIDPEKSLYYYWRGRLDFADQKFDSCIKNQQIAVSTDPHFSKPHDAMGLCYEAQGNSTQALAEFRKAAQLNRTEAQPSPWPPFDLGEELYKTGHFDEAEHSIQESLQYDPNFAKGHFQLGLLYEKSGDYEKAIQHLSVAADSDKNYSEPRYVLARIVRKVSAPQSLVLHIQDQIAAGKLEDADRDLAAVMQKYPTDGGLFNLRGILAADRKQWKAAESEFSRAILLNPNLSSAYLNLARAYETEGELSETRRILESLAAKEPASEQTLEALADVAYKQHDLQGTLGYLAHARDIDPKNAGLHFFFGIVCIELNLPVEAKKSLQKALDLEPDNPDYNYARGSVELQGRSAWNAISYFTKYVAARPDDPRGHFALGVAEFASEDYESAAAEMKRVADDKQTMAGSEYFLGRIAKAESNWPQAIKHLERSIRVDPNYAESHAELALAQLHMHYTDTALREIETAAKLNPDSYLVNTNLLIVYQWTKDPRVSAQKKRLEQLDVERSQKQELMLRTIQFRR